MLSGDRPRPKDGFDPNDLDADYYVHVSGDT